jgi:alpha-tubulin suppressor-like RCC1 family protein
MVSMAGLIVVFCFCTMQSAIAGSIVGWGSNRYGEITPPDGNDFVAIAAGDGHSLALKSDGSLVQWGMNGRPPNGNDFVKIDAGGCGVATILPVGHNLALKSDGSIIGWGYDRSGQASPPVGHDFIAIDAGMFYSLALKSDGSIVSWGEKIMGMAPPTGNDFIAISAGYSHSLALKKH